MQLQDWCSFHHSNQVFPLVHACSEVHVGGKRYFCAWETGFHVPPPRSRCSGTDPSSMQWTETYSRRTKQVTIFMYIKLNLGNAIHSVTPKSGSHYCLPIKFGGLLCTVPSPAEDAKMLSADTFSSLWGNMVLLEWERGMSHNSLEYYWEGCLIRQGLQR